MQKTIIFVLALLLSLKATAQHDPGRNAMRLLANGQIEAALKLVAKPPKGMNSPISDAERNFVQAVAACQQGDPAAAFTHAKEAVDMGMPVERFQAGPRDALAPLHAHEEYQTWLATRRKPLLHGPLLGAVTDSSASFWVRTAKETEVEIALTALTALGQRSAERKRFTGRARTTRALDYTTTITVTGLAPNTQYQYELLVNGRETGRTPRFRTFPKEGAAARFRIGFGGGAGFTPQYERMWTTVESRKLSALLLLGDNVYIDDPKHPLTQHYCYYRRQSQPEWRRLIASTSVFTIYDDHDFGTNDCVPGPAIERPEWKRKVWQVFAQNWNNPAYGGGTKQPGCWYDFHIGDVHFIMLDGRYYRDLKSGSMLGAAQKKWLFDTLKSSQGKFKVLASPVPWSPGVKPGSKDTWDGFPGEREEIFSLLEKHHIEGVLLMAADRHRSDLRKTKRPNGYDLYEVMSSRLTNVHTHGLMRNARGSEFILGYNKECSFGVIDFDTTADDPELTYRIVNIDNEEVASRTLTLSALSFGGGAANKATDK